jgi:predicted esterase
VKVKVESKSLHVHGANDALVTRDRCDRLRDLFYDAENASTFEHEGGHGVPTSKQFREAFETFLLQDDGAET